jgi:hypothetical protein
LSRDVSLVISVLHLPAPITAFNRRIGEEEREKGIVEESVREEGMSDRLIAVNVALEGNIAPSRHSFWLRTCTVKISSSLI